MASGAAAGAVSGAEMGAGLRPARYLSATKAAAVDHALMSPPHEYGLPQLMELAGQSVAHAVAHYMRHESDALHAQVVAVVCGPGNNGGDGLVAARHLFHLGFNVTVIAPRSPFDALLAQLHALPVAFAESVPAGTALVVDAVFGFSFAGGNGVRAPYADLIAQMNSSDAPLFVVDVPSGWHVERGDVYDTSVRMPAALISLTAPKLFAAQLEGRPDFVHYVGGRFVPPALCALLDFDVPVYPGSDQFVCISK